MSENATAAVLSSMGQTERPEASRTARQPPDSLSLSSSRQPSVELLPGLRVLDLECILAR